MVTRKAEKADANLRFHICNHWCRDGQHADVWWVSPTVTTVVEDLRAMLASFNLAYVHAELAPEAKPRGPLVVECDSETGRVTTSTIEAEDIPWLVIFRGEETPDA